MLFWWSETSEPSVPLRAWPWIRPINQPEGPVCVPVSRVLGWGRGSILMEIDNEKVRKHWEGFWWEAGTWIHSPIWKDKNTKRKVERPGSASKCFKWWRVRGWMVDWCDEWLILWAVFTQQGDSAVWSAKYVGVWLILQTKCLPEIWEWVHLS